eukprot:GGOE01017851.1.p1 GENE.GGOE01017851.1~~GGOE01017851.1.p1  ORF type:complete len:577 (+),score=151.80 GGOE01017851.1:109-1839(+)
MRAPLLALLLFFLALGFFSHVARRPPHPSAMEGGFPSAPARRGERQTSDTPLGSSELRSLSPPRGSSHTGGGSQPDPPTPVEPPPMEVPPPGAGVPNPLLADILAEAAVQGQAPVLPAGTDNIPVAVEPVGPRVLLHTRRPAAPPPLIAGSSSKKHVRRIGIWGRPDNWTLPNLTAHDIPRPPPRPGVLLQGYDFNGNLITYKGLPPWRLNSIYGKDYLVYVYTNNRSFLVGLNCAVSLRQYGILHTLFLCEDEMVCADLARLGAYHYHPKALIEGMRHTRIFNESYWGPSMWVRTVFNYHVIQAGIHVTCVDADVAFPADPRPVLFNPMADISISLHFRRYFPWVWSFPFMEYWLMEKEPTWHSAIKRHFVEVNNAVARYDSTPATRLFFEKLKYRSLVEIARPKRFSGWDQTAIARVFYEGGVSFDRHTDMCDAGSEVVIVSTNNTLGLRLLVFQPITSRPEGYTLEKEGEMQSCCHALGDVRNAGQAWFAKERWMRDFCCWLLPTEPEEPLDLRRPLHSIVPNVSCAVQAKANVPQFANFLHRKRRLKNTQHPKGTCPDPGPPDRPSMTPATT